MKRFAGKVVIVVGAAGQDNMGQCIARRFAGEGASVVVAGRRAQPLDHLASEIGGASRLCDFTRKEDVDALVAFAGERYGRVDVGINATGWGLLRPFEDTSEEELQAMMDLQFKGPFQFMQALVKAMRQNPTPGGSIIMISSATATIMLENHAAYMGTKAGTDHVVRCVANDFGQLGIRANSISPGITRTPMSGDALNIPELVRAFEAGYPLGRIGTVDDVAEAALWLASDVCFMTGQNLQVNGGLMLRRNPTATEMGAPYARVIADLSA
ncbi:2-hydroxycyclohexanecarboxyl-CoA dehydrogenase [Paraburkholderia sp. WC7.3g]|uniref:SDR family NAD(P)-dependent oxidoreductase n=1 Tax=Paraburkholderia sp. WC7.3g TaxID=2991070 RepID=UPI003D1FAEEB